MADPSADAEAADASSYSGEEESDPVMEYFMRICQESPNFTYATKFNTLTLFQKRKQWRHFLREPIPDGNPLRKQGTVNTWTDVLQNETDPAFWLLMMTGDEEGENGCLRYLRNHVTDRRPRVRQSVGELLADLDFFRNSLFEMLQDKLIRDDSDIHNWIVKLNKRIETLSKQKVNERKKLLEESWADVRLTKEDASDDDSSSSANKPQQGPEGESAVTLAALKEYVGRGKRGYNARNRAAKAKSNKAETKRNEALEVWRTALQNYINLKANHKQQDSFWEEVRTARSALNDADSATFRKVNSAQFKSDLHTQLMAALDEWKDSQTGMAMALQSGQSPESLEPSQQHIDELEAKMKALYHRIKAHMLAFWKIRHAGTFRPQGWMALPDEEILRAGLKGSLFTPPQEKPQLPVAVVVQHQGGKKKSSSRNADSEAMIAIANRNLRMKELTRAMEHINRLMSSKQVECNKLKKLLRERDEYLQYNPTDQTALNHRDKYQREYDQNASMVREYNADYTKRHAEFKRLESESKAKKGKGAGRHETPQQALAALVVPAGALAAVDDDEDEDEEVQSSAQDAMKAEGLQSRSDDMVHMRTAKARIQGFKNVLAKAQAEAQTNLTADLNRKILALEALINDNQKIVDDCEARLQSPSNKQKKSGDDASPPKRQGAEKFILQPRAKPSTPASPSGGFRPPRPLALLARKPESAPQLDAGAAAQNSSNDDASPPKRHGKPSTAPSPSGGFRPPAPLARKKGRPESAPQLDAGAAAQNDECSASPSKRQATMAVQSRATSAPSPSGGIRPPRPPGLLARTKRATSAPEEAQSRLMAAAQQFDASSPPRTTVEPQPDASPTAASVAAVAASDAAAAADLSGVGDGGGDFDHLADNGDAHGLGGDGAGWGGFDAATLARFDRDDDASPRFVAAPPPPPD
jgi:hypothetical protein